MSISGHSERAASWRSLSGAHVPDADERVELRQLGVAAREPEPVGLAVDRRRRELGVDRQHEHAERRRRGERLDVLARAGHQHAPGAQQARDVRAEPRRELGAGRGRPAAWAASRSAAAASEEPPPIPAATGIRFSIVRRCGGASQPVASR